MGKRERADRLLVERGIFESRARAQAAIAAGRVIADGKTVHKASQEISATAAIAAQPEHPYVSRGGVKLAAALDSRLQAVGISGYFGPREKLASQPLYRNIFGLLSDFGDAQA